MRKAGDAAHDHHGEDQHAAAEQPGGQGAFAVTGIPGD